MLRWCGTVAGCGGAPLTAVTVRRGQDLPGLEEEGGDDEDLSLSLFSPRSAEAGAAGSLRHTETRT